MNYRDYNKITTAGNSIVDKFGTVNRHPSYEELNRIITEINEVPVNERTEHAWRSIINKYAKYQEERPISETDLEETGMLLDEILSVLHKS